MVLASTAAIYEQPASVPVDESNPTDPASPCVLTKLTTDQYTQLHG